MSANDLPQNYGELARAARGEVVRRKRGRPKGATSATTRRLVDAVQARLDMMGGELLDALAGVFEDRHQDLAVRVAAGRVLFGAFAAKVLRPEGPGG